MANKSSQQISEELGGTSMQEAAEITSGIPMYQKVPTDLAVPNEFKIGNQVLNKATLIAQRDKDVQLIINGIEDKAGYDTAIIKRRDYRTVRTTIEKVRKDLSAPHQAYVKKLKEVTDEIGAEAYKGEEYFNDMIVAVDNEKARIKAEAEEKALAIMHNRIQVLLGLDAKFDGSKYTFAYAEDWFLTSIEVKELSDEDFEHTIYHVNVAYQEEQSRIEQERLEAEQEAEKVKQQAEANEAERKKLLEQRTAMRIKELTKLHGFVWNEEEQLYASPTHELRLNQIEGYDELVWDAQIADIENYVPDFPIEDIEMDVLDTATDLNEAVAFKAVDEVALDVPVEDRAIVVQPFLNFTITDTHFDIYISLKRTVRLFPDEFKQDALAGCEVDKEGSYQGLRWAIIKT